MAIGIPTLEQFRQLCDALNEKNVTSVTLTFRMPNGIRDAPLKVVIERFVDADELDAVMDVCTTTVSEKRKRESRRL